MPFPEGRAVRLGSGWRRRSRLWCGVFLCALLMVGAYVLFDLLDVDGSQMIGFPADGILVTSQQDNAMRALQGKVTGSNPSLLIPPSARLSAAQFVRGSPAALVLRTRLSRALPRVNLSRELARAVSSSSDPTVPPQS